MGNEQFGRGNLYAMQHEQQVLFQANLSARLFGAAPPTDSVTGAGTAGIGALYHDTVDGLLYINTGTLADPTWTTVGAQTTPV